MRRLFYGWIIAAASMAAWGISIGPRQSFSVFLLAFLEEFGAGRSATSAAFSVHMTFYALGGLVLGVVVDRLGPTRVIACSTALWAVALMLTGGVSGLGQLYLVFGVLGVWAREAWRTSPPTPSSPDCSGAPGALPPPFAMRGCPWGRR